MSIFQRIADAQRERRIKRLAERLKAATSRDERFRLWGLMRAECLARSPQQVARMEVSRGLRARSAIKQAVMTAHHHGWLPAPLVRLAFAIFRLRSA